MNELSRLFFHIVSPEQYSDYQNVTLLPRFQASPDFFSVCIHNNTQKWSSSLLYPSFLFVLCCFYILSILFFVL